MILFNISDGVCNAPPIFGSNSTFACLPNTLSTSRYTCPKFNSGTIILLAFFVNSSNFSAGNGHTTPSLIYPTFNHFSLACFTAVNADLDGIP